MTVCAARPPRQSECRRSRQPARDESIQDKHKRVMMARKTDDVIENFAALETNRLQLDPITGDVAGSIAAGNVAGLRPAEGWPHEHTKDGVRLAIEGGHPAGWLVRLDGRVIGDCGIRANVDSAGCVEIGYGLASPYRGQGLGTEVAAAISGWLLTQPGVLAVRATTLPSNAASRRVLEKAGFTLLGVDEQETVYERRL